MKDKTGIADQSITFDAAGAAEHPDAAFIMPLHPLVQQAALGYEPGQRMVTAITVTDDSIPEGTYPFAIYEWQFHGVREDIVLRPLSEHEALNSQLNRLIALKFEGDTILLMLIIGEVEWKS